MTLNDFLVLSERITALEHRLADFEKAQLEKQIAWLSDLAFRQPQTPETITTTLKRPGRKPGEAV